MHLTLRGIKRQIGNSPQAKLPITPQILRHLHSTIDFASSFDVAFWTACLVAFFIFFRKSNLFPASANSFAPDCNLTPSDVLIFSSFALITVKWTKTIQFQNKKLIVPILLIPCSILCPVSCVHASILLPPNSTSCHWPHTTLLIPVRATVSIKLPNEIKVIALFHHFFLQFLHIVEIGQKSHNTTTSRPSVPYILQILTTFNSYSGRPRMRLSVNNKQKIRQGMIKISRGWQPPPEIDVLAGMASSSES